MFVKHQRFDYHSIFEPVENTIQLFKYIDRIYFHSAKDLRDSLKFCLLLHTKLTPEISDVQELTEQIVWSKVQKDCLKNS